MDLDTAYAFRENLRRLLQSESGKEVRIVGVSHSDVNLLPLIIDPRTEQRPSEWPSGAWAALKKVCDARNGSALVVGAIPYVNMMKALAPAVPGFSRIDSSLDGIPAVDLPAQ